MALSFIYIRALTFLIRSGLFGYTYKFIYYLSISLDSFPLPYSDLGYIIVSRAVIIGPFKLG